MSDVLTLVFPMPENVTNRRSGPSSWRVIYARKLAYWKTLDAMQAAGALPPPPPKPWPRARLTSSMVLGGAMDDSNAMARHKHVEDWLVTRGYIVSDRKACLTWTGFPEQRVTRKEPASMTITLEAA